MKRKFTFLIAAAVMLLTMMATTGRMWGQSSYTISLLDSGNNSDGTSNIGYVVHANVSNYVSITGNSDYVNTINTGATFKASTGNGWKLSSSSGTGNFTLNLTSSAQALTVSKVTINAKNYGEDATTLTVTITKVDNTTQSQSFSSLGSNFTNYDLTLTSASTIKSIQVQANANKKRAYVHHITVTYSSGGPTKLSTPTNFAATPGNAQATFTWTAVEHASSYTISYTPNGGEEQTVASVTGTSKTIEGLTNETEYTCKIKAVGDGENYSDSDYSSTITVTPTAATYYDINITSPLTGGSVETSVASATAGTTITLTATPSAGYTFSNIASNWSVEADEGDDPEVTPGEGNTATFTMPASDITVSATFTAMPVYSVSCTTPENGTLSVSPTSGYNGVQVTITATPSSGYELATLTATDSEGEITITNNKFNIRNSNVTVAATFTPVVIDNLNAAFTGNPSSYTSWSGKTGTSGAVYAGESSGGTSYIQIRATSPSGIVTTTSGGKPKKIVVTWNSSTVDGRTLDVYGMSTAYTGSADLYDTKTDGSVLGSIIKGTSTELIINNDTVNYIGLRSNSGAMYLDLIKVYWEPLSVANPTFSPEGGIYTSVQNVEISCETEGAAIYYTTDGTQPTSSSTLYESAITISTTTTIKAIAIKDDESSSVVSATYTIELPLTTMDEIYAKALEYSTDGGSVNITFGDWVITGVNGSTAYLTDGTKGCIIYQSGHGFNVGDILSGTAGCKVKTYYDAPELYNLTSETSGLEVNTGGTVNPTTTTIAELGAVNTGSVFTLRDLEYDETNDMLSDGENEIKLKNNLYDFSSNVEDGETYHITGVFVLYGEQKQIYPREGEDIVLAADMSATDFSGLTTFTYVVNNGPSAEQDIDLLGEDFAGNLTVTASSDYELSADNTTYSTSVVIEHVEGIIAEDLYVRLKAGLATGEHNGTLTFEADNLTTKVVNLEGMVSATQTYSIMINSPIANGNVTADASVAEAGATITLTATPDECYQFVEWVTEPDDLTWTSDNQFTMPAEDVLISATFSQITYTVQYSINGNVEDDLEEDVDCGDEASLWDNNEVAILGVTLPTGFSLLGWSTTEGGTETVASFEPEADATLYAVLIPTGFVVGYELITSASQITAGKYLIAAFKSTTLPNPVKYYIANGTISSGDMNVSANNYAPTDNVFAEIPTGGVEFEFTGNNTNGFVISYDTLSLGYTTYANRKLAMGNYSTYKWKFSDHQNGLSTGALYMTCNYNDTTYTVSENATVGNGVIRGYANSTVYRGFYLFKKAETSPISNITEITEPEASMSTNIPENTCVVVNNGAVLTFTGQNNGNASNLIIQEGGQLIHTSPVEATIQKGISGYSSKDGSGWYLIASPADGVSTSGLITEPVESYDLYKYDEPSGWWYSNHGDASPFTTLERGKGYLYANANDIDLDFAGLMIGTETEVTKTLSYEYDGGGDLKGYNLMGNPFTRNLGSGNITLGGEAVTSVLLLNNDSEYQTCNFAAGGVIKPGQGFFIQATAENQQLVFNPSKKDVNEIGLISIKAGDENYIDKAYIQFDGGNTLRKMTLTGEKSQVYVMNGDEDYAAARLDEAKGVVPVHFEAAAEGTYTITIEAKNLDLETLRLIDNFSGEEIDLLVEPSYTFKANSDDPAARFTLMFEKSILGIDENDVENEVFAYQNGSDIIINGNGTLQVFDMMGRFVMSKEINGSKTISTSAFNAGVYILRIVGENMMTQKIVVK